MTMSTTDESVHVRPLRAEDAAWYYDNTGNGDPFIVVNGPGRQFGAFDGQGDWNY